MSHLSFNEAKTVLAECTREENYDFVSGNRELIWRDSANTIVAEGYFSEMGSEVNFADEEDSAFFDGKQADELVDLGDPEEQPFGDFTTTDPRIRHPQLGAR